MSTIVGQCRMCLLDSALCESHIVPKLVHRKVLGTDSRTRQYKSGTLHAKVIQDGPKQHMLCRTCEVLLQANEDYFARLWYPRSRPLYEHARDEFAVLRDYDYRRMKLFLLSVLWRAAVTDHVSFSHVRLGVKHQEVLRRMVLESLPGAQMEYPISARMYYRGSDRIICHDILTNPMQYRLGANWAWGLMLGGCRWFIHMSTHGFDIPRNCVIAPDVALMIPGMSIHEDATVAQLLEAKRRQGAGPWAHYPPPGPPGTGGSAPRKRSETGGQP
jgi:hypothetical protein